MRLSIIILIIISLSRTVVSQQIALFNHYIAEHYLINPGVQLIKGKRHIFLGIRKQWWGFTKYTPETQILSYFTDINKYTLGAWIFNEIIGYTRKTGICVNYSAHFKINENTILDIGIAPFIFQYFIDQSKYIYFDNNDKLLIGEKLNKYIYDANFGFMYSHTKYFAGFSINNLIQNKIKLLDKSEITTIVRRKYNFITSYRWELNNLFQLAPGILIQYTINLALLYDIYTQFIYKNIYSISVLYKNTNTLAVLTGIQYRNYYIAYSFEYSFERLQKYSSGTHEIGIKIDIGKEKEASLM